MASLKERFRGVDDQPAERVATLPEYLNLRKLQALLWKPRSRPRHTTWVDPDWGPNDAE